MKRELIVFILLISAFLAIGCTGNNSGQQPAAPTNEKPTSPTNETPTAPTESKTVEVSIQSFAFEPNSITVSPGDTVKWTNLDSVSHTIKGADFTSEVLKNGDSYVHAFTQVGTYDYECSIHPSMKGVVIVK